MIPEPTPRPAVFGYTSPFRARVFVSQGHAPGPQKWLPHLTQAARATIRERSRGVNSEIPSSSLSYICLTRVQHEGRAEPRSVWVFAPCLTSDHRV